MFHVRLRVPRESMTDTDQLKAAGFIVIQVEPLKWHVRGFEGMMEIWPVLKKCRPPHTYGKPVPYDDLVKAVKDCPSMVAFEPETLEQLGARQELAQLRDRLECMMIAIHNAWTCAKKPLAVKYIKVKGGVLKSGGTIPARSGSSASKSGKP